MPTILQNVVGSQDSCDLEVTNLFKIALNKVYLTKGDTVRFDIGLAEIPGVSLDYELSDRDRVYFIVTKYPEIVDIEDLENPDSCVFYKTGTSITLNPEDTKDLEDGSYYYQVRAVLGISGDLNTLIEPSDFILTPDKDW